MNKKPIIIYAEGGVIHDVLASEGTTIVVVDWDNAKHSTKETVEERTRAAVQVWHGDVDSDDPSDWLRPCESDSDSDELKENQTINEEIKKAYPDLFRDSVIMYFAFGEAAVKAINAIETEADVDGACAVAAETGAIGCIEFPTAPNLEDVVRGLQEFANQHDGSLASTLITESLYLKIQSLQEGGGQ